jgi:hypothetical protein
MRINSPTLSHVNAIGPALLMKHVLPKLPRAGKAVFRHAFSPRRIDRR